jgi:aminopeptidase N
LWLNEGFATLYENHIPSLVFPGERWIDTFLVDTVQPAMETDANPNIRAMTSYVESPERISGLFDSVAYSKAGSVLKMFQNSFGDSVWKKGLFNYMAARGYDCATPDHLYENMQTAVNEAGTIFDVEMAMKTWETQSGFPVVTIKRTGNSLRFEQDRFMYEFRNSSNLWWIPINFAVGSNPDFQSTKPDFWIPGTRSMTIQGSSSPKKFNSTDWIIANIQQTSFYRVNYDEGLWKLIIEQLENDFEAIHVLNRAQLIDDSFNLARAELLDFRIFFQVFSFLEKETDFIPWASFNRAYTLLNRWLSGSEVDERFRMSMQKKVKLLFENLGMEVDEKDSRVDR